MKTVAKIAGAFIGAVFGLIAFGVVLFLAIGIPAFWEWLGPLGAVGLVLLGGGAWWGWSHFGEREGAQ